VALATALVLALVYAATPYTAGGAPGRPSLVGPDARYVGPALVLAAGAGAAALTTLGGRVATAAGLVSLVAAADGLRWSSGGTGLLANLRPRDWIIGIAVVGLAAAAAAAVRARGARMPPPPVLGVAAGALAVLAIAGGYVVQRHYNEHRYVGAEPAIDWIDARAPSGERIAIAGVWDDAGLSPVLPAFGPRYGNRVAYLGRDDRGFLRRYQGFRAFARALRRGGYDLLVVGLGRPTVPHVPERGWARRAGFREVARSDRLALFARPT
jgi:hypothetical protein